jgi:hypothetical protein
MRHSIRRFPRLWRAWRLARRWYYARHGAYPDWREVLASGDGRLWRSALEAAAGGPKTLLCTAVGAYAHASTLESVLAAALTLRGANVHALLCDAALPACAECEASLYPAMARFTADGPARDLCRDCQWPAEAVYRSLGIRTHKIGDYLTSEERAAAAGLARSIPAGEIPTYRLEGLAVGEHAQAGALRFFATGSLEAEPSGEAVLRRYLEAALLTAYATRRLLRTERFESATFTHGIYVPWGVMGEVARQERVRVVNWNVAYRKRRFIFSHGDTYHHTLMAEPPETWQSLDLSAAQERELMAYLGSRRDGLFDWIVFHRASVQSADDIARRLGIDRARPVIGCLTNVSWDAQLHYPANAFPSMLDWLIRTVEYFGGRPDLQLLIRIHPAEISGFPPSRQPVLAELRRRFPALPSNVIVVPPDSGLSTYALMSLCNAAVIYGTKMGVELTSVGLPVIVAGEAWIRGKGLTHDAATPEQYTRILDRLPFQDGLSPDLVRRARTYAYHFFFRRMIPLRVVEPQTRYPIYRLKIERLGQLLPGASAGLDAICDGILTGAPFICDETPVKPRVAAQPAAGRPEGLPLQETTAPRLLR